MSSLKQLTAVFLAVLALCSGAKAEDESETGWKWRWVPIYLWVIQQRHQCFGSRYPLHHTKMLRIKFSITMLILGIRIRLIELPKTRVLLVLSTQPL